MNYKVVCSINLKEFETLCRELTRNGYTPAGGISTVMRGPDIAYTQAFTKPLKI